ncbi:DNA-binding transcriptional regulator, MarR family [Streptomyces sp. 3213]|uniref:MarR family winged helix-turn-helix transcriptional regulator n=1 Tax=Streptomyces sp. 3213.3 TaxID=1855348 RepID=UPI00089CA7D5|nr:MarR family transcriptional regulator [Streptomyces sp. 3213.3]SEC37674.1 DNA-binding transcriptional regulator, MarR family [Streptomyces sp. 3213] [Streptomyces sp. 3213.3]
MGQTRWLSEVEKRAWTAFTNAHALLYRRLEQRLKQDFGMSGLQYEILARLSGAPDREMRMAELAGALVNSKSGLTYQIGQMEKSGLVRRRSCPSDERAVFAVLTEEGTAVLERAAPGHVEMVRELLFDALTHDQVQALADGLSEVSRRMSDGSGEARCSAADDKECPGSGSEVVADPGT